MRTIARDEENDNDVESRISFNTEDFEDGARRVIDTTEEMNESIGEHAEKQKGFFDKIKEGFTSLSIAGFGFNQITEAATKFFDVIKSGIDIITSWRDASDEQADAVDGMNLQMKNMGIYTDAFSEKLQLNAKALSQNTNYTDQAIIEADKMLLTFNGMSEEVMPRATQAMLDMSAVMKTDLSSSAMQIGKALQDPISGMGALSKSGFHFSEQQKKTIQTMMETNNVLGAQSIILDEIELAYKGHAELQVDAEDLMKNAWTDYTEFLGSKFQPALDAGRMAIADFVKSFIPQIDKAEESRVSFESVAITIEELGVKLHKTKKEQELYGDAIKTMKELYPEHFKNIDSEKTKWNDVKTAIEGAREALKKKLVMEMAQEEINKVYKREKDELEKKDRLERENLQLEARMRINAEKLKESKISVDVTKFETPDDAYKKLLEINELLQFRYNEKIMKMAEDSIIEENNLLEKKGEKQIEITTKNLRSRADIIKRDAEETYKTLLEWDRQRGMLGTGEAEIKKIGGKEIEIKAEINEIKEKYNRMYADVFEEKKVEIPIEPKKPDVSYNKQEIEMIKKSNSDLKEAENDFALEIQKAKLGLIDKFGWQVAEKNYETQVLIYEEEKKTLKKIEQLKKIDAEIIIKNETDASKKIRADKLIKDIEIESEKLETEKKRIIQDANMSKLKIEADKKNAKEETDAKEKIAKEAEKAEKKLLEDKKKNDEENLKKRALDIEKTSKEILDIDKKLKDKEIQYNFDLSKEKEYFKRQELEYKFEYETALLLAESDLLTEYKKNLLNTQSDEERKALKQKFDDDFDSWIDYHRADYNRKTLALIGLKETTNEEPKTKEEIAQYNEEMVTQKVEKPDIKDDKLKKLKDYTENEKRIKLEQLENDKKFYLSKVNLENSYLNLKEKVDKTAEDLMNKSIKGQAIGYDQIIESGKKMLQEFAFQEAQKAGMKALISAGDAAFHATNPATWALIPNDLASVAQNTAVAVALGGVGRSISIDETKTAGYEKISTMTPYTPPKDEYTKETEKKENVKVVKVDIKSNDVAKLLMPELMQLSDDGYTVEARKIVYED